LRVGSEKSPWRSSDLFRHDRYGITVDLEPMPFARRIQTTRDQRSHLLRPVETVERPLVAQSAAGGVLAASPQSPSVKSERTLSPANLRTFVLLSVLQFGSIGAVAVLWVTSARWGDFPLLLAMTSLIVFSETAIKMMKWLILPMMKKPLPMDASIVMNADPAPRIAATTTFVRGAESIDMLRRTVAAMVAMELPHDVWVLDEGDDAKVRELCKQLGALHFSRKGLEKYNTDSGKFRRRTKYGNTNAWLDAVGHGRYEILASFDPDHVPHPEYLSRAVGYFADPKVAYVQFPQVYYNQVGAGLIARGAAEETYGRYGLTQCAAHAQNWPAVVGCHNTHRMSALREVDGFAQHDADDLLIALNYRQAGYRGVYDPVNVAEGLAPTNWLDFLKQQRRWASSVFDVKFRIQPRMKLSASWFEKVTDWVFSLAYLQAFIQVLGIVVVTWCLATEPNMFDRGYLLFFAVVAMALTVRVGGRYQQRYFILAERESGLHWRAMLVGFVKWPMLIGGFIDCVRRSVGEYETTRKTGTALRTTTPMVPHAVVAIMLAVSCGIGLTNENPPNLAMLFFGAWIGGMSVFALLSNWLVTWPPAYDDELAERRLTGSLGSDGRRRCIDRGEASGSLLSTFFASRRSRRI
jgi:cellulose synthase (UDP-forming)